MTIKNDYILMRVTASRRDGGMARLDIGRRGQPSGAALQDLGTRIEHISIVEQTLDAKQHREAAEAADARLAAGEGTVDLILPQLPLHLIRPQAEAPADAAAIAAAAPGNTAWGLPATGAWPRKPGVTGAGVRVAVLDTGIDAAHPAFAGVSISGENFVGGPVTDISDGQGHGTHCAGTIFGRAVNGIEIGIAPGVTDVLIGKVFDNNGSSRSGAILKALDWAGRRGAQVISMSLGFSFDGYVAEKLGQGYPQAIAVAIAIDAFQRNLNAFSLAIASVGGAGGADVYGTPRRGAVVVVAAGNASQRQINPAFVCPASLPANTSDDVVAVAALGQPAPGSYRIADFSNGEARLSAPGVDVLSARAGGGLALMSGTSMACPHVAGLAALWWQFAAPGTRASMIRSLLEGNARPNQILAYTLPDHGLGLARAP